MTCKMTPCPVETTLQLISSRWKVLIIRDLLEGTKRFGELRKSIGPVTQKVLTANLWASPGIILRRFKKAREKDCSPARFMPKSPRAWNIHLRNWATACIPFWLPCPAGERPISKWTSTKPARQRIFLFLRLFPVHSSFRLH